MKQQVNITTTGQELLIREGDAPKVFDHLGIIISGKAGTVLDFINHSRDAEYFCAENNLYANTRQMRTVIVRNDNESISIVIDPEHPNSTKVSSLYYKSKDLADLHLNEKLKPAELLKSIRQVRRFLESPTIDMGKIDTFLKSVTVKRITNAEAKNDMRGSGKSSLESNVEGVTPLLVTFLVSLYGGGDKVAVKTDLCVTLTSGEVEVWFDAPYIDDQVKDAIATAIEMECGTLKTLGYFIVTK